MRISLHKKRIHRKILVLIVIIGVLIFLFANKNFQTLLSLNKEIAQLKQKIAGLKEKNRELEDELQAVKKDSEYFDSLARRELGLIKPGETKYKFVESQEEK